MAEKINPGLNRDD